MLDWFLGMLGFKRTQAEKAKDETKDEQVEAVKERSRAAIERAELLRRMADAETLVIRKRRAGAR